MKIVFECPNCGKVNSLKEHASNRYKLSEKIGTEIHVECSHCEHKSDIHINRVYAKADPIIVSIVAFVLSSASILISRYLAQTYWRDNILVDLRTIEVVGLGFIIPILILSIALPTFGKRAEYFNSYRL
ncbi:hypothetical protein BFP97_20050 [Roseivirga sp. 4D4]|nr:hypothetical protein BFP97_20050 [Roseivirga sp. 4D4]